VTTWNTKKEMDFREIASENGRWMELAQDLI
jgi:hypothetical protein